MNNLYNELGVEPNATDAEIKQGYRRAAQASHPDKNDGDDVLFHQVQIAYDVLSDPDRRERYDETGDASERPKPRDAAEGKMAELFAAAISEGDDKKGDVIEQCRARVFTVIHQLNATILRSEVRAKHLERQRGRVTTTGEFNLYDQILTDELKHVTTGLSNMRLERKVLDATAALLDSYEDGNPAESLGEPGSVVWTTPA